MTGFSPPEHMCYFAVNLDIVNYVTWEAELLHSVWCLQDWRSSFYLSAEDLYLPGRTEGTLLRQAAKIGQDISKD